MMSSVAYALCRMLATQLLLVLAIAGSACEEEISAEFPPPYTAFRVIAAWELLNFVTLCAVRVFAEGVRLVKEQTTAD